MEEVTGNWRKLRSHKTHNWHSSPNRPFINVIRPTRMSLGGGGHLIHMGQMVNA
jgi:hypothetical protein